MVNVKRTSVTKRHGRYGQICKNRRGLDYCYGWLIVVFDSVIALFPTIITGRYRAYPIESSWIYVKTIGSIERDGTFLLFPFIARCAIDSAKTFPPGFSPSFAAPCISDPRIATFRNLILELAREFDKRYATKMEKARSVSRKRRRHVNPSHSCVVGRTRSTRRRQKQLCNPARTISPPRRD